MAEYKENSIEVAEGPKRPSMIFLDGLQYQVATRARLLALLAMLGVFGTAAMAGAQPSEKLYCDPRCIDDPRMSNKLRRKHCDPNFKIQRDEIRGLKSELEALGDEELRAIASMEGWWPGFQWVVANPGKAAGISLAGLALLILWRQGLRRKFFAAGALAQAEQEGEVVLGDLGNELLIKKPVDVAVIPQATLDEALAELGRLEQKYIVLLADDVYKNHKFRMQKNIGQLITSARLALKSNNLGDQSKGLIQLGVVEGRIETMESLRDTIESGELDLDGLPDDIPDVDLTNV